jgi:hypothetical protein
MLWAVVVRRTPNEALASKTAAHSLPVCIYVLVPVPKYIHKIPVLVRIHTTNATMASIPQVTEELESI